MRLYFSYQRKTNFCSKCRVSLRPCCIHMMTTITIITMFSAARKPRGLSMLIRYFDFSRFWLFTCRTKLTANDARLSDLSYISEDEQKIAAAKEQMNKCLDHPHLLTIYERNSDLEINQAIMKTISRGKAFHYEGHSVCFKIRCVGAIAYSEGQI